MYSAHVALPDSASTSSRGEVLAIFRVVMFVIYFRHMVKHFIKILLTFVVMIACGLLGVYLINNYDLIKKVDVESKVEVAK